MLPIVTLPSMWPMKFKVLSANSTLAIILAHFRPLRLALAMNSQAPISTSPDTIAPVIRKFWVACSCARVACLWLARSAFSPPTATATTLTTMPIAVSAAPAYIRRTARKTDRGGAGRSGAAWLAGSTGPDARDCPDTADFAVVRGLAVVPGAPGAPGFAGAADCPVAADFAAGALGLFIGCSLAVFERSLPR